MLLSIIAFILILGVLVFVHELGHFLVAKFFGMRVDEFSIGFPPRLISRKKGDTLYSLNLIPLGGYVRIHGQAAIDAEEPDPRSFRNKPVGQRIAVIVAGVIMNLLFAFLVLTVAFSVGFISVGQQLEQVPGAKIIHSQVVIDQVLAGSPADRAGVQAGDLIKSLTDLKTGQQTAIYTPQQLADYTHGHQQANDLAITVSYSHEGQDLQKSVTLNSTGPGLGIGIDSYNTVRIPVWRAPGVAVREIRAIASATWGALKGFAQQLFVHAKLDPSVSGPIGIYQASSSAAHQGFLAVIYLVVVLSINLALLNILPLPPLDGGLLFFLLIELIFRGRGAPQKVEAAVMTLGTVLVFTLIIIISIKDVIHLF